jgi:SAM-dependent methyltransferase
MKLIEKLHNNLVFKRRVQVLASHFLRTLPNEGRVLDVGCGDGLIDALILQKRSNLQIEGIDVLVRPHTHITVTPFDGYSIPHPDESFDAVIFVDVLHHTESPITLLQEAKRVTRRMIILKDHLTDGVLARPTLRFMDWVGNAHHGVVLPYNYWSRKQWQAAFSQLDMSIVNWQEDLALYPFFADWAFGRSLHFIASLKK